MCVILYSYEICKAFKQLYFPIVTRMENGINSISDLIKQDKVKWGTVTGTNAEILLSNANSPELVEVYTRMVRIKCRRLFRKLNQ